MLSELVPSLVVYFADQAKVYQNSFGSHQAMQSSFVFSPVYLHLTLCNTVKHVETPSIRGVVV